MKKLLFTFLSLLMTCFAFADYTVYVGGSAIDGTSSYAAYWKDGVKRTIWDMKGGAYEFHWVFESENVYCGGIQAGYNGKEFRIYKNGSLNNSVSLSSGISYDVYDMAKLNNNIYYTIRESYSSDVHYMLFKDSYKIIKTYAGRYLETFDGYLYYTKEDGRDENMGYNAGGSDINNTARGAFYTSDLMVYGDNVYLCGKDYRGACVQVNNDQRYNLDQYGKNCTQIGFVGGVTYYIIDGNLIDSYGVTRMTNVIEFDVVDNMLLYVLCKVQSAGITKYCYQVYYPAAQTITSRVDLPSCNGATTIKVIHQ